MEYDRQCPGWWVRFVKGNTIISGKKFNDKDYIDGKDEALSHAQDWRDWELERLVNEGVFNPCPSGFNIPPIYSYDSERSNNKSGYIGVHRCDHVYKSKGKPIYWKSWKATWVYYDINSNGKIVRKIGGKQFSINKWGEEEAKRKAIAARKDAEEYALSESNLLLRNAYLEQERKKRKWLRKDAYERFMNAEV